MNVSPNPQVVQEQRQFGDILQEDFVDSYMNLTLKSVMGLKWASRRCPSARFLMKTDDDMFVNVPKLLDYLTKAQKERWITGEARKCAQEMQTSFVYFTKLRVMLLINQM